MTGAVRRNLRETVRLVLAAAGPAGLTQVEVEAAIAALPLAGGQVNSGSVSGTIGNLCTLGVVRGAGRRPGRHGRAVTVFVATGAEIGKGADVRNARHARARAATPLPEDEWPREVRRAVDVLRRRSWAVWPIDSDLWEAGVRRTTDQLLDLADRIAPELGASPAEAP